MESTGPSTLHFGWLLLLCGGLTSQGEVADLDAEGLLAQSLANKGEHWRDFCTLLAAGRVGCCRLRDLATLEVWDEHTARKEQKNSEQDVKKDTGTSQYTHCINAKKNVNAPRKREGLNEFLECVGTNLSA